MLRIRADIRANVRPDEALMASMGSSGLPSVIHRATPMTSPAPLKTDVLKAYDKYQTGLAAAVAKGCLPGQFVAAWLPM